MSCVVFDKSLENHFKQEVNKMDQEKRVLAAKPGNSSLTPETYMVEDRTESCKLSCVLNKHTVVQASPIKVYHSNRYINVIKIK